MTMETKKQLTADLFSAAFGVAIEALSFSQFRLWPLTGHAGPINARQPTNGGG